MTARKGTVAIFCWLFVAACGGLAEGDTTTSAPVVTESVAPSTADSLPPTTSESSTTTEPSANSPSTTSTIPLAPTLDDGRPTTFMAVTDDYEAVEVETATGAIIHRFGQRADAETLAAGVEIAPNVVDGIWRSSSGDAILISECCEPAAGRITLLSDDGSLDPEYGEPAWYGWWVVPSPSSDEVIITGYSTEVVDATEGPDRAGAVSLFENDGSGVGAIGWSPDGAAIHWYDEGAAELVTWIRSDDGFALESRVPIDWVGPGQYLSGLDAQPSGNLVSFLNRSDPGGEPVETRGVVYSSATGELVAEFEVPSGSYFGGYEPSGRFLIYTTPAGEVTYQGLGRVGVLGEGYLFASW